MNQFFLPVLFFFLLANTFQIYCQESLSCSDEGIKAHIDTAKYYIVKGEYALAEKLLDSLEVSCHESMKRTPYNYGQYCTVYGKLFHIQKNSESAEFWYTKAIEVLKDLPGSRLEYAQTLSYQADLDAENRDYIKALNNYKVVGITRKEVLGNMDTLYAITLVDMALALEGEQDYQAAKVMYLEALDIWEKSEHIESKMYPKVLNSYGLLMYRMGDIDSAITMLNKAMEIEKTIYGETHDVVCMRLINLAQMGLTLNQFELSERYALQAKFNLENQYELNKQYYTACLHLLGNLYYKMRLFNNAEKFYTQAIDMKEEVYGIDHVKVMSSVENLGLVYWSSKQYEKAEKCFQKVIKIRKEVLGENDINYAGSLNNLGLLYSDTDRPVEAIALLKQSLKITESVVGRYHDRTGIRYINLGAVYNDLHQYDSAIVYLNIASDVFLKIVGRVSFEYSNSQVNLAQAYWSTGNFKKSEDVYKNALQISKEMLENSRHHLSNSELDEFIDGFIDFRDQIISMSLESKRSASAEMCFDQSIYFKGYLLDALRHLNKSISNSPEALSVADLLKENSEILAQEYSLPIHDQNAHLVDSVKQFTELLEKELNRLIQGYSDMDRDIRVADIRDKLSEGEAAIEFVRFRHFTGDSAKDKGLAYAALIVKPNQEFPDLVYLCSETDLAHRLKSIDVRKADYVNNLYSYSDRGLQPGLDQLSSIYELIWKPLELSLKSCRVINYSPDGLLHIINHSAIPFSKTELLTDRYTLSQMTSTRNLVEIPESNSEIATAVLFGGISYDLDTLNLDRIFDKSKKELTEIATRGDEFSSPPEIRKLNWSNLDWTLTEVESIQREMEKEDIVVTVATKTLANEETVKTLGQRGYSPSILHLATHGYFFSESLGSDSELSDIEAATTGYVSSSNPLMRSGLILAGGNYAWKHGKAYSPYMDDGVLTAYEISQLDFSETQLVVLSACETGLGEIRGSEGVYGLQRAFRIAGVQNMIISLWQVPDRETAIFMETFYRSWIGENRTIAEAFRNTQNVLRSNPFITPYQWAGFVLVE